jgi:hypothetical protein
MAACLTFATLCMLVGWRLRPPPPRSADSPREQFSAERAAEVLRRLTPDDEPHPTGTPAQNAVRARLLRELRALGLEPEEQQAVACSSEGTCAALTNVVAVVRGLLDTVSIGVLAHYDSVPAGPGAGDDGQGTASLVEIARALNASPPPQGVALIFTDGEELGTLGARAFVAEHPLARSIRVVLNLEGRGNRGPSLMFETTAGNRWLVERYAAAPRPVATSLFAAVYHALPNDTDLTVFARHGIQGLNFAFIQGVESYHTSGDTLAALDLGSVQQQGDAALATLRALLSAGVEPAAGDSAFFDLFALTLVRVPVWLMPVLASLAWLLFALTLGRELRRRPALGRQYGRAALRLLGVWTLPCVGAAALALLLEALGALPFPIVAHPEPLLLGLCLWAVAGSALALGGTEDRERLRVLWDVTWLAWLSAGSLACALLPAASYLGVVPAAAAALSRSCMALEARLTRPLMLVCAALGAALGLPVAMLLYPTLGFTSPSLLALAFGVFISPFGPLWAPLLGRRLPQLALCTGGALLGLGQLVPPPYSATVPQRVSLALEVDPSGRARWHADASAGPLPAALREAGGFGPTPDGRHPWPSYRQDQTYVAPALLPPPSVPRYRIEVSGPRLLRLYFEAAPEIWALGVRVEGPARLARATWRGRELKPSVRDTSQRLRLVPGDDRSIVLDLEFEDAAPDRLELVSVSLELPEAAAPLLAARAPRAVTSGMGDMGLLRIDARP